MCIHIQYVMQCVTACRHIILAQNRNTSVSVSIGICQNPLFESRFFKANSHGYIQFKNSDKHLWGAMRKACLNAYTMIPWRIKRFDAANKVFVAANHVFVGRKQCVCGLQTMSLWPPTICLLPPTMCVWPQTMCVWILVVREI